MNSAFTRSTPFRSMVATAMVISLMLPALAQNEGDYRTIASGNWNSASIWERHDGVDFQPAATFPTSADGLITVRDGHLVTINSALTLDQVVIESGATLNTANMLNLADGPGPDLQVEGVWVLSSASVVGPGSATLSSGGSFNWTGGSIGLEVVLDLMAGSTATFDPGPVNLSNAGTINNAGTWTMLSGNLIGDGIEHLFNNLATGVLELNGWESTTSSWGGHLNNAGTINKNNGDLVFATVSMVTNDGTININGGEWFANGSSFQNNGSINGASGTTLRSSAAFDHNSGADIDGIPVLIVQGGNFNLNAGSTINPLDQLLINGGTLNCGIPVTTPLLDLSLGSLGGPGAVSVPSGGEFNWTGGSLTTAAVIDLLAGSTATFDPGDVGLFTAGTINNAGTWTMLSGNLLGSGIEHVFNNLSSGVLELNGWQSTTSSWGGHLNNAGTINKNNGDLVFATVSMVTNDGTININGGEWFANGSSFQNNGSINGASGTTLRSSAAFDHNNGADINGIPVLIVQNGNFNLNAGSTINPLDQLLINGGTLNCGIPVTTPLFDLSLGSLGGPSAVSVSSGGAFNWTGGSLITAALIDLPVTSTTTFDPGDFNLFTAGTINNAGTWTMLSGNLLGSGSQHLFNNMATGVLDLNGWQNTAFSWGINLSNSGTINKNNGATLFTINGGDFTNQADGTLSIPEGSMTITVTMPEQQGTFLIGEDVVLTTTAFPFAGGLIENNGTINSPQLTMQGSGTKQLTGTGSVDNLRFDGSGDTELNGDWTVTNTANFVNGRLLLGENDLVVSNAAAIAVQGGNATSHVVTEGNGRLVREVGTGNHVFPIGTGSNYLPITLNVTDGPQERFTAGVQEGVHRDYAAPGVPDGLLVSSGIVERTWVLTEETPGGNTATVTLQWNPADEAPDFDRSNCAVARYDGDLWSSDGFDSAEGGGPFNRTLAGITAFREFTVADSNADLNGTGTSISDVVESGNDLHVWPNPAQNVLHIAMERAELLVEVGLIDMQGRRVAVPASMQGDRMTLQLSDIPSGTYLLEVVDGERRVLSRPVIVAR